MKDMILILSVAAMFAFGYFVVKRIDRFVVNEKRRQTAVKHRKR